MACNSSTSAVRPSWTVLVIMLLIEWCSCRIAPASRASRIDSRQSARPPASPSPHRLVPRTTQLYGLGEKLLARAVVPEPGEPAPVHEFGTVRVGGRRQFQGGLEKARGLAVGGEPEGSFAGDPQRRSGR